MAIGYTRGTKISKKECGDCGTVWDDDQILDDSYIKHGYGDDSCPFCHTKWRPTQVIKLKKLTKRG